MFNNPIMKSMLKVVLDTVRVLAFIYLFFCLFIFMLAHGSGHRIPTRTNVFAYLNIFGSIGVIVGTSLYLRSRSTK